MTLRIPFDRTTERLSSSGEVHVWSITAADWLPLLPAVGESLDAAERERAARFRFERDFRRFTLCRGLLRTLLGNYLGVEPRDIAFRLGPYEKPELESPSGERIEFNLSHSDEAALFVFAAGRRVGVDIERMRPGTDVDGIGQQVFTPAEIKKLSATPEHEKQDLFFAFWTQKEALIKAAGLGLSAPVREITVGEGLIPRGDQAGIGIIEAFQACWSVLNLDAPNRYKAALAVEGRLRREQLRVQPLRPSSSEPHSEPRA